MNRRRRFFDKLRRRQGNNKTVPLSGMYGVVKNRRWHDFKITNNPTTEREKTPIKNYRKQLTLFKRSDVYKIVLLLIRC